jgi:hypothetical protein
LLIIVPVGKTDCGKEAERMVCPGCGFALIKEASWQREISSLAVDRNSVSSHVPEVCDVLFCPPMNNISARSQ